MREVGKKDMQIYRLCLGTLSFRIEIHKRIDPDGLYATIIARRVAKSLNNTFFDGTIKGSFPPYALKARVHSIAHGSLIVTLILHADVMAGGAGLFKFLKDYPSVRAGILKLASDLHSIYIFSKKLSLSLHDSNIRSDEQVQAEITSKIGANSAVGKQVQTVARKPAEARETFKGY